MVLSVGLGRRSGNTDPDVNSQVHAGFSNMGAVDSEGQLEGSSRLACMMPCVTDEETKAQRHEEL